MENIYVVHQHIGYKRHLSIKNKLIVDENVADIVKKIFDMYVNGHGCTEILNYLNTNKYLSPIGYRKMGIVKDENKTDYNWNEVTICNILKNEVYIGNTVQNKKSVVSYKIKKIRKVEKENQIRVNNTHEAIIDKEIFEKVQCIIEKKGTNTKLKYDYLLRGLIYCYHCKRKLQIVLKKNSRKNSKSYPYITCSDYKSRNCYPLNINYKKFENYIIYIIKRICQIYANRKIFYLIYDKCQTKTQNVIENFKIKLEQIYQKINDLNNNLDKAYIDKLNGIISEEDYLRISQKFISDRTSLNMQKKELEKNSNEKALILNEKSREIQDIDKLIENFLEFEKIDKMYLYRLINKIEIDKDKNIYIYFNFSKLDFINKNLNEFIKLEEII